MPMMTATYIKTDKNPAANTGGATYTACPATTATVVKAAAGLLFGVFITGTGTAGTVVIEDTGTIYFTAQVPAAVVSYFVPFPPQGVNHITGIKITTTGAGVTAAALWI